jgi:hypothetical protein
MAYAAYSQRKQARLTAACDELFPVRETSDDDGYTSLAIDLDKYSVTLYWRGPVPSRVQEAAERVRRSGITVHVMSARYSLVELQAAVDAVISDERRRSVPQGLRCISFSPAVDGSGVEIVTGSLDDELVEARRHATAVPLHMTLGEPPVALSGSLK